AEAARTVGSPQIRNRGTLGGNLGTSSPAGDALPPLLVDGAEIELASEQGTRIVPLAEFLVGPKRNVLREDELIAAVRVRPSGTRQTFMKVGPRNAMVISVCSLAVALDRERDEIREYDGRVRLCPYFFVTGEESVTLGGVLATIAPADKRLIHGMTDAVMTSSVLRGSD
ncbi:MAG: FAD binding domain-containing protein, partial [Candidatus Eremiobacteraeota bacterium]|nr:FAD binding domain-containing protein [Candidatus Eremiobacteraeota bacterium]